MPRDLGWPAVGAVSPDGAWHAERRNLIGRPRQWAYWVRYELGQATSDSKPAVDYDRRPVLNVFEPRAVTSSLHKGIVYRLAEAKLGSGGFGTVFLFEADPPPPLSKKGTSPYPRAFAAKFLLVDDPADPAQWSEINVTIRLEQGAKRLMRTGTVDSARPVLASRLLHTVVLSYNDDNGSSSPPSPPAHQATGTLRSNSDEEEGQGLVFDAVNGLLRYAGEWLFPTTSFVSSSSSNDVDGGSTQPHRHPQPAPTLGVVGMELGTDLSQLQGHLTWEQAADVVHAAFINLQRYWTLEPKLLHTDVKVENFVYAERPGGGLASFAFGTSRRGGSITDSIDVLAIDLDSLCTEGQLGCPATYSSPARGGHPPASWGNTAFQLGLMAALLVAPPPRSQQATTAGAADSDLGAVVRQSFYSGALGTPPREHDMVGAAKAWQDFRGHLFSWTTNTSVNVQAAAAGARLFTDLLDTLMAFTTVSDSASSGRAEVGPGRFHTAASSTHADYAHAFEKFRKQRKKWKKEAKQ